MICFLSYGSVALGSPIAGAAAYRQGCFIRDAACAEHQFKSVFGLPVFPKNILVIDPTKDVKGHLTGLNRLPPKFQLGTGVKEGGKGFLGRAKVLQFDYLSGLQPKIRFLRLPHWQPPGSIGDLASRSLAKIFDDHLDYDGISEVGVIHIRHDHVLYMDVGPQLLFGRPTLSASLKENHNNETYGGNIEDRRGRVARYLIEHPEIISIIVGSFFGAIGIAFYFNNWSFVGIGLLAIGMVTPLLPWWLLVWSWWAAQ